jgi:DNA-directed RNA polymerase III subunit RPC3
MSNAQTKLCEVILEEYFGKTVSRVGSNILDFGYKTLAQIISSTGLSVRDVRQSVSLLLHHDLAKFSDTRKPGNPDYSIQVENVLCILYYPQYLSLITRYGEDAALVLEEVCKVGRTTFSDLLLLSYSKLNPEQDQTPLSLLTHLEKEVRRLILEKVLVRCSSSSSPVDADVPELVLEEKLMFSPPEINLKGLVEGEEERKDKDVYWKLNLERLNQLVRDEIIEEGAVRRLDRTGGRILRSIFSLGCELYDPWAQVSGHLGHTLLVDKIKKDWVEEEKLEHLEQYLTMLSTDRTRFIDKVGDAGGGQYTINFQHIFEEITAATIENIILERFGSKSMRIFRYILEKKYVEENQIQQVVMIPGKETKLLTFQLMEENFLSLQELRKNVAPTAPSKAIYLFYVNLDQVVRSTILLCQKSIYNLKSRNEQDTEENSRLLEKYARVEGILESVRAEGGTEEQIEEVEDMLTPPEKESILKLQYRTEQLNLAQMAAAETLFILKTYLRYKTS